MAKDEATEEVSIDEDVPVDDVLSDAQDTLDGIEGGGGDDLDAELGGGGADATTGSDLGTDFDTGLDAGSSQSEPRTTERSSSSDSGGILPSTNLFDDLFSSKHFLGAAALAAAGAVGGGLAIPIPAFGSVVGLFVAGFLMGAISSRSSYVEVGITTGIAGALIVGLLSIPFIALAGLGLAMFGVGAVASILVGLLGHYFGRDLRSGLTRDVGGDDDGVI